jgi:hypothetical protein
MPTSIGGAFHTSSSSSLLSEVGQYGVSSPPAGFEPAMLASWRPHIHALDRAASGMSILVSYYFEGARIGPAVEIVKS